MPAGDGDTVVRHWTGAAMTMAGAWLVRLALQRRRRAMENAARGDAPPPPLHPSLAPLADLGPPIIVFGLVVAGAQVALAFFATEGGGGLFSLFDLAGFLVLLLGYGAWVKAKVAHRAGTFGR